MKLQLPGQTQTRTRFTRAQPLAAISEQLVEHGFEQLPGPMAVGVGQRGACRRFGQTQMLQFPFTGLQPFGDLPKRFRLRQLTDSMATNCPQLVKPRA